MNSMGSNVNLIIRGGVISKLRWLLIFGVVYIHNFGEPYFGDVDIFHIDYANFHVYDLYDILRVTVHDISGLAVPCFFFFSGFLFFFRKDQSKDFRIIPKLKRRVKSLIIPYLIWNIIAFLIIWLRASVKMHDFSFAGFFSVLKDNGWLRIFWDSSIRAGQSGAPADVPLWYLRDLIIMEFVLSPLLLYLFKKKSRAIFFLSVLFVTMCTGIYPDIPGLASAAVFWYSMGAFVSIHNLPVIERATRFKSLLIIISSISLIAVVVLKGSGIPLRAIKLLFILSTIPLLLISTFKFGNRTSIFLIKIQSSVFFVFAAHMIVILEACRRIISKMDPNLFMVYLIPPLLTVAICTLLYFLLNKFTPRLCNIINGR